jgi:hypothetical protein
MFREISPVLTDFGGFWRAEAITHAKRVFIFQWLKRMEGISASTGFEHLDFLTEKCSHWGRTTVILFREGVP